MNQATQPMIKLFNGQMIHQIGYGTYQLKGQDCVLGTTSALKCGYRHIDTASIYKNGKEIGQALKNMNTIPREDLFIVSKISPQEQGYQSTLDTCKRLINELGCGYLDVLLIHWPGVANHKPEDPQNATIRLETYKALEELVEQKQIRGIGVSNFLKRHLEHLLKNVRIKPVMNQIEIHPLGWDVPTVEFCFQNEIAVEAYSPLARQVPEFKENQLLNTLSTKYQKTISQIALRWGLQKGFIVIPKSKNEKYIQENMNITDFQLTQDEISSIDQLNVNLKTCWDPEKVLY